MAVYIRFWLRVIFAGDWEFHRREMDLRGMKNLDRMNSETPSINIDLTYLNDIRTATCPKYVSP